MRRSTLATFNLEEDSSPSPANAKASEEYLTALLHTVNLNTVYTVWRKEQDALPSNIAELTFQPRCDMATGILLELDTLCEALETLSS